MEPYIQMNTQLRKKTTSDFDKDLFKRMNNSVLGKTMENVRKRIRVELVKGCKENRIKKLITNPL